MLDPTFLVLALLAVTGFGKDFAFRTIPQDVPGFKELPVRYIRNVANFGDGTIAVTTGAGLGITSDGGQTYDIRTMRSGLPSNNVRASAITEDGVLYAVTYGVQMEVAMSLDQGQSFRDISASLPDLNSNPDVYRQAFFAAGKRVFLLLGDGRLYFNTDSEGGPFVKADVLGELGLNGAQATKACETSNGDIIVGLLQTPGNAQQYSFARVQVNGSHYSVAPITPSNTQTAQYLLRKQGGMACFTRNGSPEIALTRLDTILAFLTLDGNQVTYSHYVEIPTGSNPGDQPIYPTVINRAGSLFVIGYPVIMQLLLDANGKETGFTSLPLNSTNPNSPQNQINNIEQAANGDWLIATQWGWFRCNNELTTCSEAMSKQNGIYGPGVLDQNDQGFLFPQSFGWTSATNTSATNPLFWSTGDQAWTLDPDFRKPIPFTFPGSDQYVVQNAKARGNRMAVMVYQQKNQQIVGRVVYVDSGNFTLVDMPFASHNMFPQIRQIDQKGERVFIDTERGTYVSEFGGNFTTFSTGTFPGAGSIYSSGNTLALTSDQAEGQIALSFDRGKTFSTVPGEKFGLPAQAKYSLGAYRGIALAVVNNAIYQLSFSPLSSKLIFVDPSTQQLSLVGDSDAGLWLDAGPTANTNSKPRLIASNGQCYTMSAANGFSGDDDFMAFVAGSANSTLYFAGPNGVMRWQPGFNQIGDCGVAQLP